MGMVEAAVLIIRHIWQLCNALRITLTGSPQSRIRLAGFERQSGYLHPQHLRLTSGTLSALTLSAEPDYCEERFHGPC
ncbi:MAG: hypothetical protein A2075_19170 [Geobacteraceae bacterium GWC2_58_44]|nr:MAG: hypothetical protein A2075_19170 [Geobacteraceae bacterium GWC2_58_44]